MKLRVYELHENGIDAVETVLRDGKSLASALLALNDLKSGRVETYLPEGISEEQLNSFDTGGVFPTRTDVSGPFFDGKGTALFSTPVDSTEEQLITYVNSYLKSNPLSLAIFENPIVEPHFPWLKTTVRKSRIHIYGSEIVNCVTADEVSIGLVHNLIGEIGGLGPWPGLIGTLVQGNEQMIKRWKNDFSYLSKEDIDEVASSTERIIIGAYDGEGDLEWSKLLP